MNSTGSRSAASKPRAGRLVPSEVFKRELGILQNLEK
jgi:hypothetical protein